MYSSDSLVEHSASTMTCWRCLIILLCCLIISRYFRKNFRESCVAISISRITTTCPVSREMPRWHTRVKFELLTLSICIYRAIYAAASINVPADTRRQIINTYDSSKSVGTFDTSTISLQIQLKVVFLKSNSSIHSIYMTDILIYLSAQAWK